MLKNSYTLSLNSYNFIMKKKNTEIIKAKALLVTHTGDSAFNLEGH